VVNGLISGAVCKNDHNSGTTNEPFYFCGCSNNNVTNADGFLACIAPNCGGQSPMGNFAGSCSGYYVDTTLGFIEGATCKNDFGQSVPNNNFEYCTCPNLYVVNDNGNLTCGSPNSRCGLPVGDWQNTCTDYMIDEAAGAIDGAICRNSAGSFVPSYPTIFSYCECGPPPVNVKNSNGDLVCG